VTWVEDGPPPLVREALDFHQYAYGVLVATQLAARLGVPAITVAELGVAGGNGLLEIERLAAIIGKDHRVAVHTVGFDLGTGMPAPVDYRDVPYAWHDGFFRMDEVALRARLGEARLLIGDVAATGRFYLEESPPPLGFVSFDLDYYSATAAALSALFESDDHDRYLPRVVCYFDDTIGPHSEMHSEHTGELLAIREYNDRHTSRKLARINGLRYKLLPIEGAWVEGIFVLHLFDHPRYGEYVYPDPDRQFPLDPPAPKHRMKDGGP
jgi:hypothetical protein